MFKKAEKKNLRLRMALCGPAGAGKTYSALSVATAMGGKIAVVDTEHGSASKYADIFNFDTVQPDIFDPRQLIETIRFAEKNGYSHIIVDSLSHYWSGKGGELDMVDNAAARSKSANTFTAWKTVTPVHNELIETIIGCKINVFVTMRTKTEYVIETVNGKQVPRKVGLAPVMRDGIEYEFDLVGDIDQENNFVITKSRCPALSGQVVNRPGRQIAEKLIAWLNSAPKDVAATEPVAPKNEAPAPTLYEKISKQTPEMTPEDAVVVDMPQPEIKAADRPTVHVEVGQPGSRESVVAGEINKARAIISAGEMAAQIKQARTLAQKYGCKSQRDFAELTQTIIGKPYGSASQLTSDDERAMVIAFLLDATREEQKEAA